MNRFNCLAIALAVLSPCAAQAAGTFVVAFCPAAQVRTYALESQRGIQGLVLQNVAVTNRASTPAEISAIEIDLLDGNRIVDSRNISGDDLVRAVSGGPRLQASGMMPLMAFQFCGKAMIADGVRLAGPVLNPGEAMLITSQPFAFKGKRDALRLVVHGRVANSDVSATADIPIYSELSKTVFRFPLRGTWFAAVGPTLHTEHRWALPEEFAFDIVKLGEGGASHSGSGDHFSDYFAYGAEVRAAADGRVVGVLNTVPEDPALLRNAGDSDESYLTRVKQGQMAFLARRETSGNFVMIDHGNGEYSLYAHLQMASVTVKIGDTVKAGQPLGKLGSSGNSTEPHLHFQVCDAADPLLCAGTPVSFQGVSFPYSFAARPLQSGDIIIAE